MQILKTFSFEICDVTNLKIYAIDCVNSESIQGLVLFLHSRVSTIFMFFQFSQLILTWSKSTIEKLEKGVKYIQS